MVFDMERDKFPYPGSNNVIVNSNIHTYIVRSEKLRMKDEIFHLSYLRYP